MSAASRRTFLKTAAMTAAACVSGRRSVADSIHVPVGCSSIRSRHCPKTDGTLQS
jgi:hypothetical protein